MPAAALIDYGCHSFTYRLASHLSDRGLPIRYFVNGSLESPNLSSLAEWSSARPGLLANITCQKSYGKMSLHRRLRGEIQWAGNCIRALEQEDPAAVIASCVPLAAVTRIQSWARRRGIPFIYWLQDLQGRAIHQLLGRKFGFAGRFLGGLAYVWEQHCLELSNMVITIAPGHEQELPATIQKQERFALLENWANIEEFPEFPSSNDWSIRNGLDRTTNIVYSGTLGLKHDLEVFYQLAAALKPRPAVRVVAVSSGEAASHLRQEAIARGLDNLLVLPFQPYQDVPKVLASATVLIAPLDRSAGAFCVPSKILSYLCAGRATVLAIAADNPAAKTIERAAAGTIVEAGNQAQFVRATLSLLDDPIRCFRLGRSARAYAEATFTLENVVFKFLNIVQCAGVQLASPSLRPAPKLARSTSAAG